jgi:hypothetical protein
MRRLCALCSKPPYGSISLFEHALAGVPERRVAEVVRQRDRLAEVLVQAEHAAERAGDLAGLDRVREPGAIVVALVVHEDLRLVLEPPKAVLWMTRSRSRWNGRRNGCSGSACTRPRVSLLRVAYGARLSSPGCGARREESRGSCETRRKRDPTPGLRGGSTKSQAARSAARRHATLCRARKIADSSPVLC